MHVVEESIATGSKSSVQTAIDLQMEEVDRIDEAVISNLNE